MPRRITDCLPGATDERHISEALQQKCRTGPKRWPDEWNIFTPREGCIGAEAQWHSRTNSNLIAIGFLHY
jgi:hypothetical protein